jgi:hypothetical protein
MESSNVPRKKKSIEVCSGPDCSAGGAAILEIEELVKEDGSRFCVIVGGCRNLCSMGPNVYHDGCHFPQVKSPEDCERIAAEAGMQLQQDDGTRSSSRVAGMLMKKANRLRWQVLRDVARHKNRAAAKRKYDMWRIDLEKAHCSELGAARMYDNSTERCQRADRRFERLQAMIETAALKKDDVDKGAEEVSSGALRSV